MRKSVISLSISIAVLLSLGILMVYNTTSAELLDKSLEADTRSAFFKQLSYAFLGIIAGSLMFLIGYKKIVKASPYLLFFITLLLALVFVPKIGQEINGAKRWLKVLTFSFQPSEIAKYFIPIFFINWVVSKENIKLIDFIKILVVLLIPIVLIFLEPDNGTCAIILSTLVVTFFLTKINFKYWGVPLLLAVTIGSILAYNMPHVRSRIDVYLNPEKDLRGKGHQPYQAKIAAGSGKLFGKGLGASLQKLNYLPEARSDYIAAIYAEELGFIGVIFLIFTYFSIAVFGFFLAIKSKDKIGFYTATCITFLISFQAFLNLGVVSGLLPSKGTTLPFFSQGGSSLMVNLLAVGILLSTARVEKGYERS
jgi:cell division protein FtsW